jgi:lipopolysaccharide/colanic/teichoic acid biosynthesis glycosyltransferase
MTILERSHVPDDMQARLMRPRVGPTMFPPSTWQTPPRHAPFAKAGTLDYARKKRIFDLAIALPLAIASLPLVVILAIGSAISFRAWPIFTQIRLGHHGKEFRFVKIRSLPVDAPATADKYELAEVQNTAFGRFLRKFHLDELPQLWLVAWGTMSLVGPRPEMPALAATFDPDFVAKRTTVKPGCTGLWQISDASAGLIGEDPQYDTFYVTNPSLRLDLWLLARTSIDVLGGPPLTSIDDLPEWIIGLSPAEERALEAA